MQRNDLVGVLHLTMGVVSECLSSCVDYLDAATDAL